jgi:hypothetical protein
MYLAAIHGKVPTQYAVMEDFVTSNVFGFLKYADRSAYLGPVLQGLGIEASARKLDEAEFEFWPSYDDGTEPDVVLRVAGWHILFEAKWLSGFGRATTATDAQVERELRGGILAASQEGRQFLFVAVTPDFHHEVDVRALVPPGVARSVRWLRWGDIAGIVQKRQRQPNPPDDMLAQDFLAMMSRYDLMPFQGFGHLAATGTIDALPPLFLRQSRFRFNGFQGLPGNLESPPTTLFLKDGRS